MIRKSRHRGRPILIIALALFASGCMPLGVVPMKIGEGMGHPDAMMARPHADDNESGTLQIVDQMIAELVTDLLSQRLEIATVAVWRLRARPDEVYRETVRQKLINQLVASHTFTVVSRERLRELLEEQGLSETGAIDEGEAVEIGALTGVDGFIDGYLSINKDRYLLSLSLIDAKSGVITWAKTAERGIP